MPCWLSVGTLISLTALAQSPPAGGETRGASPDACGRRGATCLAAAGEALASGGHGGVDLFLEGKRIALGGKRNVFALAFAGERLVEAGGRSGEKGEVAAWDWKRRQLLWSVEPHREIVQAVAVVRGKVFSGSGDRTIAVLDLEKGAMEGRLEGHAGAVLALAASPDGALLVSAGVDRSLRVWDTGTRTLLRAIRNHGDAVHALAWSADGKYLASGSADRTVRIWQPSIGRLVRIVRGHEGAVLSLAYAGARLASGSSDGRVRLIDPESDAVLQVLDGHADWVTALAATPQGLASADWSGRVLLWKDGRPSELK